MTMELEGAPRVAASAIVVNDTRLRSAAAATR